MIKWENKYSTGVLELDEQHKKLFKFTNDLEDLAQEDEIDDELLAEIIDFLREYAEKHFGREEECMNQYRCPVAGANKAAHQKFIKLYKDYQEKVLELKADKLIIQDLQMFLEDWLKEHICKIDTRLKACVH